MNVTAKQFTIALYEICVPLEWYWILIVRVGIKLDIHGWYSNTDFRFVTIL